MPESRGGMELTELGLGGVLKLFRLRVPPNQREYSWREVHVQQLFDDLARAVMENADYFLGAVVTIPQDDDWLEVVDGQQRLATTAIFLAAIRDYLVSIDEKMLVESINNEFLTGIVRSQRMRAPKLQLNVNDNEMFSRIVAPDMGDIPASVHESHERLLATHKLARERVRSIVSVVADRKQHGDLLDQWVSFLENRAVVVLLRVSNSANAYKMFETLNGRGLRTSQADLIKNYLFGTSGSRMTEVQARWSYMRGTLETIGDADEITITFLRHALIVLSGHLTEAQVYDKIQEIARSTSAVVTLAWNLESMATTYAATFTPDHEKWNRHPEQVGKALETFSLFNIVPMRPLILAVGEKFNVSETTEAYRYLVAMSVRLMIASSTRSGSVEEPLAKASHRIWDSEITTAAELKKVLINVAPSDDTFRAAFTTAKVSNQRLARYYLRALESAAAETRDPWYVVQTDPEKINLEHVMPKKPDESWNGLDADTVSRLTTRLGNLALMRKTDNSLLRSVAFMEKRAVYADSPYVLTRQLGEVAEWSEAAIVARQTQMALLAVKAWSIK